MNCLVLLFGNFIFFGKMFLVVEGIEVELINFMVLCRLFKMMLIDFIIIIIDLMYLFF